MIGMIDARVAKYLRSPDRESRADPGSGRTFIESQSTAAPMYCSLKDFKSRLIGSSPPNKSSHGLGHSSSSLYFAITRFTSFHLSVSLRYNGKMSRLLDILNCVE